MAQSLPAVTGTPQGIGEAAVSACLFVPVTRLDGQRQRVGVQAAGPGSLVGLVGGDQRLAEAVERLGLTRRITGLPVQRQGPPEMAGRLWAAALPQLDKAKAGQHLGLT